MIDLILFWFGLLTLLLGFTAHRRHAGGALTIAYFLGLSLIHVPGCLVYLTPSPAFVPFTNTRAGFSMTLTGLAAFLVGVLVSRSFWPQTPRGSHHVDMVSLETLGWRLVAIGVATYFVITPIASLVPSMTAIVSPLGATLIIGLWLLLYSALLSGNRRRFLGTLALLPLLPLTTLVTAGFIGFGTNWVISVVGFLYVIVRRRTWFYLAAPLVVFLGLSLFVTYMGARNSIRELEWQRNAAFSERIDRVAKMIGDFQFFDINNAAHAAAIDGRLNQNLLVGAGINRHLSGLSDFEYGATIPLSTLVPRALWTDKPVVGGSGDMVTRFTGIPFAKGTSVGVGQVLEFYMNFGSAGVVVGFFALGFGLMWLDGVIMRALRAGDSRIVLLAALPGLALLQPGGSLIEMLVSSVGAYIGARLMLMAGVTSSSRSRVSEIRLEAI